VFGSAGISCDVRQVDLSFEHRAELDLGFFRRLAQTLERLAVLAKVDALIFAEFFRCPVDDLIIPVIAAEMGVAIGGFYFHHPATNLKQGNVKSSAAKVEDQDDLVLFFIEAICQG